MARASFGNDGSPDAMDAMDTMEKLPAPAAVWQGAAPSGRGSRDDPPPRPALSARKDAER
jgi:hypothetical protein